MHTKFGFDSSNSFPCRQRDKQTDVTERPTHAGSYAGVVSRNLTYDPKINGFPGLVVEHFHVKSGDTNCSSF